MDPLQAIVRLCNHANVPTNEQLPEEESLSFQLLQAQRNGETPNVSPFVEDIVRCLRTVNAVTVSEVRQPHEMIQELSTNQFHLLAYSVSGIIRNGLEYCTLHESVPGAAEVRSTLMTGLSSIAAAWDDLLAGDITRIAAES